MKNNLFTQFLIAMSLLVSSGCDRPTASAYPTDTIVTRDGTELSIRFFKHASLAVAADDRWIYFDPVGDYADYEQLPKAAEVLVTHSHFDHFDPAAIEALCDARTRIVCDSTTAEQWGDEAIVLHPGESADLGEGVLVEAVAAYNTTPSHLQFHPRERQDCGYILTIGGLRLYVAGDTEPTPELLALRDIDVAFLPVNQPYTMTVEQAVTAIKAIRPRIFYPYHYGQVETKTDLEALQRELEEITDVRIRPME